MNLIMMAAGEGTRLRPFTYSVPKPAIPFLNIPLAAHSLSFLKGIHIDKLVVNTFHLPDKVHQLFTNMPHRISNVCFSDEIGLILGNGGGLGKAYSHLKNGGDFIMMNSDEVVLPQDKNVFEKALAYHKASGCLATLLVMEHHEVGRQFGGVWVDAEENVLGFGKTQPLGTAQGWHYIGVQILSERIFDYIPVGPSNILHDVMKVALTKGEKVQCFPFKCTWFETGNIQDLLLATNKCMEFMVDHNNSRESECLSSALKHYAPSSIKTYRRQRALVCQAESATLHDSTSVEGSLCLGHKSIIEQDCFLKNVIIADGVTVKAGTTAENTILL